MHKNTRAETISLSYSKRRLKFTFAAGTSRGVMTYHDTYFITIRKDNSPQVTGIGEAAPLSGLSPEYGRGFEEKLNMTLDLLTGLTLPEVSTFIEKKLHKLPSIRFAIETALADLNNGGRKLIFDNGFFHGDYDIPINGLVWMGDFQEMEKRLHEKVAAGFTTIKIKVGGIDFEKELKLLEIARSSYGDKITLRVDANGAFDKSNVFSKLEQLSIYDLHSIEQPVKPGNSRLMQELCKLSPVPVALDEELIAVENPGRLLDELTPAYLVIKPTLVGGLAAAQEWIDQAQQRNIGWWLTSALESNIGLNAISQLAAQYKGIIPQGLGTGSLYHNNVKSPLEVSAGKIRYNKNKEWE